MVIEKIDTIVVGGGQAGISMSEHLGNHKIPHLVLERKRIAEAWRSGRWDSLLANGPAWHDRLPSMKFSDTDPDSFPTKEKVADYLVEYAKMVHAPIRCGIEVRAVRKLPGRPGFHVETSKGEFEAINVVAATGPFQRPNLPPLVPETEGLLQIHSSAYKNPEQLPRGSVLVVGAGASGAQIADELMRAGRRVYLSVGRHARPPRWYRMRDSAWWSGVLGVWDATASGDDTENVPIAVSGVYSKTSIDFRRMAEKGMILVGSTAGHEDGSILFANNLKDNIEEGNKGYLLSLDEADAYVEYNGLDLPEDPTARVILPVTPYEKHPVATLNIASSELTSIIWATGFSRDYSWIKTDVLNENGNPVHSRGISREPGVYFLGLPFQSRRSSSFLFGVWHDAKYIADHIACKMGYLNYR
jgi:putative flavoprotein involved in K+ transport